MLRKKNRLSWFMLAVFMMAIAFSAVPAALTSAASISDIQGHWAATTIQKMVDQGIVTGMPDGSFKPDNSISRAEFATLVVKAFKLDSKDGKVFNDTSKHWAKDYIATANAYGILNGYSDANFGPDDPITREQMAVMVVKAAKLQNSGTALSFSDSTKVSAWAQDAVATASTQKIITGFPDGSFQPQAQATRAQAVIVLSNALQQSTTTPVTTPTEDLSKLDKAGTYGPTTGNQAVSGDVTISASGVILQNVTISGNLLISDAVGDGDVTLNNVTVKGTTTIKGGSTIHLNNCVLGTVEINKSDGKLTVVLEGTTSISSLVADSVVTVSGQGTITKATINKAGVVIETKPGSTTVASGITATIAGLTVKGTSTSSGGGGSSSSGTVSLTATSGSPTSTGVTITGTTTAGAAIKVTTTPATSTFTGTVAADGTYTVNLTGLTAGTTYTANVTASKTGLSNRTATVNFSTTGSFTATPNGNYNGILGYINLTVSDSSMVTGVSSPAGASFYKVDATTIRVTGLDTCPSSIILTLNGTPSSYTVTITTGSFTATPKGNYNGILGYINLTVSDSTMVTGVSSPAGASFYPVDATTIRVTGLDTCPNSITLNLKGTPSTYVVTIGSTPAAVSLTATAGTPTSTGVTITGSTTAGAAVTVTTTPTASTFAGTVAADGTYTVNLTGLTAGTAYTANVTASKTGLSNGNATVNFSTAGGSTGSFTATPKGNYNGILGYIALTVSDSTMVTGVSSPAGASSYPVDATTIRVTGLDTCPNSITLTLNGTPSSYTVTIP